MNIVRGKIDREDLARWRLVAADLQAATTSPSAFSAREHRDMWLRKYQLAEEMVEKYGINDDEDWNISNFTGQIIVEG